MSVARGHAHFSKRVTEDFPPHVTPDTPIVNTFLPSLLRLCKEIIRDVWSQR